MQLNKKAEYAIFLLAHLSEFADDMPIPGQKIAELHGIPPNLIPQISTLLNKKGWIQGKRGPGGGLTLTADPRKITIRDVIETISGEIALNSCLLKDQYCPNQGDCPLHEVLLQTQRQLYENLDQITIHDLGARIAGRNGAADGPPPDEEGDGGRAGEPRSEEPE